MRRPGNRPRSPADRTQVSTCRTTLYRARPSISAMLIAAIQMLVAVLGLALVWSLLPPRGNPAGRFLFCKRPATPHRPSGTLFHPTTPPPVASCRLQLPVRARRQMSLAGARPVAATRTSRTSAHRLNGPYQLFPVFPCPARVHPTAYSALPGPRPCRFPNCFLMGRLPVCSPRSRDPSSAACGLVNPSPHKVPRLDPVPWGLGQR